MFIQIKKFGNLHRGMTRSKNIEYPSSVDTRVGKGKYTNNDYKLFKVKRNNKNLIQSSRMSSKAP